MPKLITTFILTLLTLPALATPHIRTSANPTPREQFAAARLRAAVANLPTSEQIILAQRNDPALKPYDRQIPDFWPDAKEAFLLRRLGNTILVTGYDASGTLYGALELASRIQSLKAIPKQLDVEDHPQLKLRGTAIGMQKPKITYEGAEYDYPYTPKDFPFFYDKAYWTRYLDMLTDERINTLYLWSGHPFTSLLKLPKYPEAQELPTAQLEQNIAMYRWLTAEADKRGIWVLQGFYNIHLSHAFARAHKVPYHLSAPTPLASDYTRYCISEFIHEYPNVGIFMTLGEAMGPHYGAEWLTKTIIPGVKDGLAELAKQEGHPVPEPPIVVRAHATDIEDVMAAAKPLYSNIDTMWTGGRGWGSRRSGPRLRTRSSRGRSASQSTSATSSPSTKRNSPSSAAASRPSTQTKIRVPHVPLLGRGIPRPHIHFPRFHSPSPPAPAKPSPSPPASPSTPTIHKPPSAQ